MKNSLLLISGIYPPDTGGPASFTEDFAHWLSQNNEKVSVVTYTDGPSQTKYFDSIKITYIHRYKNLPRRYICFAWSILRNYNSKVRVLAVGAFLETMLASMVRDLNYTIKIPGDIVWERARNSGMTDLDINDFQVSNLNFKYRIFRKLFTLSIARAAHVVVPSEFLRKLVVGWIGKSKPIELIYNSIDTSRFSDSDLTKRRFDVITACRLVPWKGVDELIRCCDELGLTLGIAGEGPEEEKLKQQASKLGAVVTFLGQIPKDEISDFYRSGEIFVLNSSYEGLPHALIEAKAIGLLCIGRSGTGSEEVITHLEDGILVSEEPGSNLKEALSTAISDPELVKTLRLHARNDVSSRFDRNVNFQHIYRILAQV